MTQPNHTSPTPSVSPLRQRMIEDMSMRKLKPSTQRNHLRSEKRLTTFWATHPTQPPQKNCVVFSWI